MDVAQDTETLTTRGDSRKKIDTKIKKRKKPKMSFLSISRNQMKKKSSRLDLEATIPKR